MAAGVRPEQIAIVYGTDSPYAPLLAAELTRADIAWYGPTATTLGATALARVVNVVLTMAAAASRWGLRDHPSAAAAVDRRGTFA